MASDKIYKHMLGICSCLLFLELMDLSILSSCALQISQYFHVTLTQVSQSVLWYVIGSIILIPAVAWVTKKFYTPSLLIYSIMAFIISSILCSISSSWYMFVSARFLQGVAISICSPLSIIMLMKICPIEEQVNTIGLINMPALLGSALGPFIGALLTYYSSWQYIFYINVPICIILITLIYSIILKPSHQVFDLDKNNNINFDFVGFSILSLGIIIFAAAIEKFGTHDTNLGFLNLIISIILLITFTVINNKRRICNKPVILDLTIFHDLNFKLGTIVNIIARLSMCGIPLILVAALQVSHSINMLVANSYIVVIAISGAFAKLFTKFFYKKLKIYNFIILGVVTTSIGIFLVKFVLLVPDNALLQYLICIFFGFSMSLLYTSMNSVMLITIDKKHMADACNVQAIIQQLFTGFGTIFAMYLFDVLLNSVDVMESFSYLCSGLALLILVAMFFVTKNLKPG